MKDELAGTTAVVVLLKGNKIYCGNVGDSRAVASVGGRVQQLSYDHKPGNEAETKRIIAAGGWVEFNRVNGNLALSRALGDFVFKKNEKSLIQNYIKNIQIQTGQN
ncbi:probable protein phosphatase 2C T23F11.1 [Limulus polyphemus]|uniref:protein-serine/threonine phosphatase n=1 Tax=Limulus polyphemus TaxID=6850 RepID=A0ABM1C3H5_LIMPO|nr:probable protein phosphatase 2C T23F11.1 [Limulus polyphemus]